MQELYRKLRSILNKMTLEKLQRLMQQVDELNIDTEERLKGCIDVIFEKVGTTYHRHQLLGDSVT